MKVATQVLNSVAITPRIIQQPVFEPRFVPLVLTHHWSKFGTWNKLPFMALILFYRISTFNVRQKRYEYSTPQVLVTIIDHRFVMYDIHIMFAITRSIAPFCLPHLTSP